MSKKPFVTKEQIDRIVEKYPTPFHIYDEKGIRENARNMAKAFSWNKGFKEYFAVKATPNPYIMQVLKEEGCGFDCSSMTELMMSEAVGSTGTEIMFSSNATPPQEFVKAKELGAIINLDDFTHVAFLEKVAGLPKRICCRYNPGGVYEVSNGIMDNPGDAKYGMTKDQMIEAYRIMKEKGVEEFGIHSFLCSNTVTNDYYPMLARTLFELAVELKEKTGANITFINLSGGVGIPYRPEQKANDIFAIGEGVRKAFEEILVPAGMGDVAIFTELGRFMLAPYGQLVATAVHEKHIYKEYIGLDACAVNLMRPAMSIATTSASGFILIRRSRMASTLRCPTVADVACSCLLIFVSFTLSQSTSVICLTPVRTRLSAHQLPTPPMPNMMTRTDAMPCMTSLPRSLSVLLNMFCSAVIILII